MSQEALNRSVRRARRTRALGPDARCSVCGTADPDMLVTPRLKPRPTTTTGRRSPRSLSTASSAAAIEPLAPPADVVGTPPPVLCYECLLIRDGKATTEDHHVLGEANNATATVPVPGNQHRLLSDLQCDWPEEVRDNRERDPLLELSGWCLSLKDHLLCWLERLTYVAAWLIHLCHRLREHFGTAAWWEPLGMPPLWGEAEA
jgi:hypothetical protein